MKNKHSIGVWFYSEIGGEIISMPFQTKICSRISGNSHAEAKANGKLMSLAPEMYDILHQLCYGDSGEYDNAMLNAHKIIEKLK